MAGPVRSLRILHLTCARHRPRLLTPVIPRRRRTMFQVIRRFPIHTEAIIIADTSRAADDVCIPRASSHAFPLFLWVAAGRATGDLCAGVAVAGAAGAVVVVVAEAVVDEGAEVVGGAGVGDGAGGKVVRGTGRVAFGALDAFEYKIRDAAWGGWGRDLSGFWGRAGLIGGGDWVG